MKIFGTLVHGGKQLKFKAHRPSDPFLSINSEPTRFKLRGCRTLYCGDWTVGCPYIEKNDDLFFWVHNNELANITHNKKMVIDADLIGKIVMLIVEVKSIKFYKDGRINKGWKMVLLDMNG